MVPWHPALVHFALALVPVGLMLDLVAWAAGRPRWHNSAHALLVLATLGAIAAVLSGNVAAAPWRGEEGLLPLIERHEDLATAALLLLLATSLGRLPLYLRSFRPGSAPGWSLKLWVVVAGLACGLLWQAGRTGGELVYRHGVGVQLEDRGATPAGPVRAPSGAPTGDTRPLPDL